MADQTARIERLARQAITRDAPPLRPEEVEELAAALLRSQQPACTGGERVIWTQDGLSAEAIIIRAHQHDDSLRLIQTAGGEHWARVKDLRSQQPGQDERKGLTHWMVFMKPAPSASRIDCGECPSITSGCESGKCLKAIARTERKGSGT